MPTNPTPSENHTVPASIRISLLVLAILVLASLALNAYLIQQWRQAKAQVSQLSRNIQPVVQQTFDNLDRELVNFQQSTLEFNVQVNQQVPLQTEVSFSDTIDIPLQMTLPISHEISTTIMVDPFGAGFTVPMAVNVPINMEFPINQQISIPINRTIPISTSVPLSLTLPINIPISNTSLAPTIDQIRRGADDFEQQLNQRLSGIE